MRVASSIVLILVAWSATGTTQVQSRPGDPPLVTAVNEPWFVLREPIHFGGDVYYPAGPAVFFDGNRMVRAGIHEGIPVYADTTLEPFSVVLVPVSRGLLQPYERLRRGELAGTSGSRPPSFPVQAVPESSTPVMAPVPPTGLPDSDSPAPVAPPPMRDALVPAVVASAPVDPTPVASLLRPESNDGVWIAFGGKRWISDGAAVPLVSAGVTQIGEYAGFPVFARPGIDDVIYLPSRAGLIAPYRLKA